VKIAAAAAMAQAGRLYPSVILHGGDDPGRRAALLQLARTLLCERETSRPCGECKHCRRIEMDKSAFHPDFHFLERDQRTVTSVDATKEFLRAAHLAPFEAGAQVFGIANAETLSGAAANALLKTLEEPPARVPRHFFLLSPSQLDLLPTLRSRSMAVYLGEAALAEGEKIAELSGEFAGCTEEFQLASGGVIFTLLADVLERAGDFRDTRSAASWTTAAAVVAEVARNRPHGDPLRSRLLKLAEHLLTGPDLRVRGIPARRILEGFVSGCLDAGSGPAVRI